MKTLTVTLNVLGFTALFIAYTAGVPMERPTGVRRALQTYASQLPDGACPAFKPVWELGTTVNAKV